MTEYKPYYWTRNTDGNGTWTTGSGPSGQDLAALRRGIGREAGSVPAMWPFYTSLPENGYLTKELNAEHITLTLFAVHQQSRTRPVHRKGVGLGTAIRHLRENGKFSEDAVDRRFASMATATSIGELSVHLRGLINQLRTLGEGQGIDYTQLYWDLHNWQYPERVAAVRRRWGAAYFTHAASPEAPNEARKLKTTTSASH